MNHLNKRRRYAFHISSFSAVVYLVWSGALWQSAVFGQAATRLRPDSAGVVSGRVTFPNGQPAAGVTIRLEREIQEPHFRGTLEINTTQTDTAGRYSYNASWGGRYGVAVASNMGPVKHFIAPQSFFLKLGQQKTNVNFVLTGSATATGQVVDSKTGKPLPYVSVTVPSIIAERGSPINISETDTDFNGRYKLQIPSGKVVLELNQTRTWRAPQKRKTSHQTINAKPGETLTVNWRVPAAGVSRP